MADAFFTPPEPEPEPAPRPPQPPWAGPPYGVLPGVVALEVVVAASEQAAVYLGRCAVYPAGFELDVQVSAATDADELAPSLNGMYRRPGRKSPYEDMLRFGLEYADGRRVTNVERRAPHDGSDDPERLVLNGMGGGGGGGRWHHEFWVWPLPPPGPLAIVCEWPAAGIALTRVDIDAQMLIDAALRSRRLFPDAATSHPGGSWSAYGTGPGGGARPAE